MGGRGAGDEGGDAASEKADGEGDVDAPAAAAAAAGPQVQARASRSATARSLSGRGNEARPRRQLPLSSCRPSTAPANSCGTRRTGARRLSVRGSTSTIGSAG